MGFSCLLPFFSLSIQNSCFYFFNILFCELKQVQAAKMTSVFVQDNRHHLNLLIQSILHLQETQITNVVSRWENITNSLSFDDIYNFSLFSNGKLNRQMDFFFYSYSLEKLLRSCFYQKLIFNIWGYLIKGLAFYDAKVLSHFQRGKTPNLQECSNVNKSQKYFLKWGTFQ